MDFAFIEQVGNKVYEILINDPDQVDWFYTTQKNFDSEDTSKLITTLVEYLSSLGNEESKSIVNDIKSIIKEDENADNLLSILFFPKTGEEEEEEADNINENNESIDIGSYDEETYDPQTYFNDLIKEMMQTLYVSHDIAYLLLKKYNWGKNNLIKDWLSDQTKPLNLLNIKIGSELVPNAQSSLKIKKVDVGECPVCYDDESPLFECYCGHKLCFNCLIDDIKQQILENKVPVCRQTTDDDKVCGCEFMYSDMENLLSENPTLFNEYKKVFLKNEIVIADDVRFCQDQYCNYVITPENQFPCHVGICPKCHSFDCLKCRKGCHAPLIDCSKVEDFLITQVQKKQNLKSSQDAWFLHEKKMAGFRFNHPDDVRSVFNEKLNSLRKDNKIKTANDQEKIDLIDQKIIKLESQVKKLEKSSKSCQNEINKIESEIHNQTALKKRLEMEKVFNEEDRMNCIATLEKEEQYFMSAIIDFSQYQYYMTKFEEIINESAIETISKSNNDDTDFIESITKRCPKCKTPIERTRGCNHMTCSICQYEFCYVCGEEWIGHTDYFICDRYKIKFDSIDSVDYTGSAFVLPPMSAAERADYMRWNNLYAQYNFQLEKYNKLLIDLSSKENAPLAPGKKLTFSKLCTRNKIASVLLRDTEISLVKNKTLIIMNTLLFAQSVLVWGPPAIYYMQNERKKALLVEYKLSLLQTSLDKFLELIHSPGESKSEKFETNVELLRRQIFDILAMAEE